MVHLHNFGGYGIAGPKDYWKLDSGFHWQKRGLREKLSKNKHSGFKIGCGNTARLRELYVRHQRGLLSFESLPLQELRQFATVRGITVDPNAVSTVVKAQLEKADNEATFDRFTDLPPEVRQIIFRHYYESLLSSIRAVRKYQPPITMVSRMIRQESLPLLYGYCGRLEIVSDGPITAPYKLNPSLATAKFLQSTPAHLLARIRLLQLTFTNLNFRAAIDLSNQHDPVCKVSSYGRYHSWEMTEATLARQQHIPSALRALATSIAARPGPLRLQLSDIEDMGEMVRSIIADGTTLQ